MDHMDFMNRFAPGKRFRSVAEIAFLFFAIALRAQDHTVLFSTGDPGVGKAITNSGLLGSPRISRHLQLYRLVYP
jgi:hypothetical protein